jgi:carboxypeptidase C (cathepsin A)
MIPRAALALFCVAAPLAGALAQPARHGEAPRAQQGEGPAPRGGPGSPQANAPASAPAMAPLPADKTTRHAITLQDGRTLAFLATAGSIRLANRDTGAPVADIAFLAFELDAPARAQRPVAFAMNGGPGYASAWLNLGAMGPWRLRMDEEAARPSAPASLETNAQTWLPFTDLVFLDPAGTGYSRTLGGDDTRKWLWSVNGDIDSLATTIRRWLEARGRGGSPVTLVGESYGGFRVPKIAHRLQVDQGVGVSALALVSPVLDFGRLHARRSLFDLVARLPAYAAGARAAASRADLADVESYARGEYLADLMRGVNDAPALARLTAQVARLTGLPSDVVARHAGRVPLEAYVAEIARAQGKVPSLYDARVLGLDPSPYGEGPDADDQMRLGLHAPIVQAMVGLYRDKLEWVVPDGRYQFQNEQAGRQWDWSERSRQESVRDLQRAMALDPALRTLIVHGLTDLVTPYFETQMVLDQLPRTGDPARLRFEVYAGGHMFYSREASRSRFRDDARALIAGEPAARP